jgi:iron complex transport system permease protein
MGKKFILLFIILIFFFALSLTAGSVYIPFNDVLSILFGEEVPRRSWEIIVWDFRLPKAITAVLAGSGLAISGLLMQTFFRNPLAGPFVLGISSGASLGVAILMLANFQFGMFLLDAQFGSWIQVLASGLGSALVMLLVFLISIRIKDSMSLLIIGLMIASLTGAIVSILQFFSSPQQIQSYLFWTFGSLGGVTWLQLQALIPVVIVGISISFFLIKPLNALLIGERYAETMGVNLKSIRIWVILCTSLLAGSITAFCGPIAFVGIAIPHFCRMLFNTSAHNLLVPSCVLFGGILMLICDLIAQMPGMQTAIPVNAVTSIFGAPVVIYLILYRKNIRSSFSG